MSKNDSYTRWQRITITQLGFTTNLIFTITIAIIGFSFKTVTNSNFLLSCSEKYFYTAGFIILLISFVSGIIITFTRLIDFRLTAKTARKRENNSRDMALNNLRCKTKYLGKATWGLFWVQISTFGLGTLLIVIVLLHHYSDKFF